MTKPFSLLSFQKCWRGAETFVGWRSRWSNQETWEFLITMLAASSMFKMSCFVFALGGMLDLPLFTRICLNSTLFTTSSFALLLVVNSPIQSWGDIEQDICLEEFLLELSLSNVHKIVWTLQIPKRAQSHLYSGVPCKGASFAFCIDSLIGLCWKWLLIRFFSWIKGAEVGHVQKRSIL